MNKLIVAVAFVCLLISIISSEEVSETGIKQDLINADISTENSIAAESETLNDDKNGTTNKNETEDKSEASGDDEYDDDDDEEDDELASKELSTLDQIFDILTNVVVAIISPDEPEPVKETN